MADTVTVTADALNVRQGAGAEHAVITSLPKGTKVQRLEESGGKLGRLADRELAATRSVPGAGAFVRTPQANK